MEDSNSVMLQAHRSLGVCAGLPLLCAASNVLSSHPRYILNLSQNTSIKMQHKSYSSM